MLLACFYAYTRIICISRISGVTRRNAWEETQSWSRAQTTDFLSVRFPAFRHCRLIPPALSHKDLSLFRRAVKLEIVLDSSRALATFRTLPKGVEALSPTKPSLEEGKGCILFHVCTDILAFELSR